MARSRKDLLGLKASRQRKSKEILKNAKMLKQLISQPSKKASHLSGKTSDNAVL